jgi:CheY-like chemotaxis protein
MMTTMLTQQTLISGGQRRLHVTPGQALSGKHVIVIEDNPIVRMGIEDVLRGAGAHIARSFSHKADAAVLDVTLGSGITAIPIAKTLSLRQVPFLFYTGQPETVLAPIREQWPECRILPKPSTPQQILAGVVSLVDKHGVRTGAY